MKKTLEQQVFESINNERIKDLLGYVKDVDIDSIFKQYDSDCKEKVSCKVLENCHDYFLHITKNENVYFILNEGIKSNIQELKKTRLIAKDVYGKALDQKIIDVMHDMKIKDSDFGNYTVLEVFLGGHRGMTLYKDLAMEREDCCFTYETIRPERIKIYKKLQKHARIFELVSMGV